MLDAIKPLLDSGIINESTQQAISEAWEAKLSEAKETVRAELREEFAQRYQHDKSVMVEALDKMVTESLTAELAEFQEEKRALAEDRAKFKMHMNESASKFNNFLVTKLAEEIQELRKDRKVYENSIGKLESFVIKALAEEIKEFEQDKQAVVETKVRLIAGAKEKLAELQQQFIARSSVLVKEAVAKNLESELTQLKEDIHIARENMFGRRLFEAFASEFAVTHLNENKEIAKLQAALNEQKQAIAEARRVAEEKAALVESKETEIRVIKESAERKSTMADLLKPLSKEKAAVMSELLESVQTAKLQSAYEKYLPAVLNNKATPAVQPAAPKQVIAESRVEVTGDKAAKVAAEQDDTNVIELKRLAGLK
jgi:predicted DNA-binding protein